MYSISQIIADSNGVIITLFWTYSNVDGKISNQLRLSEPVDTKTMMPRADVTEQVATEWLEEQLGNTSEDFDKAIAQRKAQQEYVNSLSVYINDGGTFIPPKPEVTEPEVVTQPV